MSFIGPLAQRVRGQWAVYYTSPQSFTTMFLLLT